ncbi:MAG: hypothetical protein EXR72_27300 [Myxococcales bacterium]|nr:hypothetical protein [Myxococcales bacterium]
MCRARGPVAALLLCTALARVAAADEKELILSAQPGFSFLRIEGQTTWGGGGGIDLSYGVTDALAVRVTGALTAHSVGASANGPGGTALAWLAGVGVTYTLDILRVVPYVDFAIGLLGTRHRTAQGSVVENNAGVQIGLGVDYLVTRRFAVGVVVRYQASLAAISELPAWLYAGPRIAVHFGG